MLSLEEQQESCANYLFTGVAYRIESLAFDYSCTKIYRYVFFQLPCKRDALTQNALH